MLRPVFGRYGFGWNPLSEMRRLKREMSRLTRGPLRTGRYDVEIPPINVWLGENDAIVTAELPGIDHKEIDMSVEGNSLVFSGSYPAEESKEGETYHRRELYRGRFNRSIQIPFRVDPNKVEAKYEKGIIRITLHRTEEDKPRKIAIKTE